ncbi:hypothetical protein ABT340_19185 [Streptosporangium sp. NPDC000239]|uniref:hypothetical protein n=1 Tax=Streptosporangium sp. NPDC000239 TaxID=3154248 RepID=UPI00332F15A1
MPLNPNGLLTEGAAVRLAGDNVVDCQTGGVSVLLGDAATVVIADPRDGLDVSGVWNSRRFHLHGPFVDDVGVRLFGHPPTPPDGTGPTPGGGAGPSADPAAGRSHIPGSRQARAGRVHERRLSCAALTIEPELTPELLDRVRPSAEPETVPNLDWLTRMTTRPLEALTRFVLVGIGALVAARQHEVVDRDDGS